MSMRFNGFVFIYIYIYVFMSWEVGMANMSRSGAGPFAMADVTREPQQKRNSGRASFPGTLFEKDTAELTTHVWICLVPWWFLMLIYAAVVQKHLRIHIITVFFAVEASRHGLKTSWLGDIAFQHDMFKSQQTITDVRLRKIVCLNYFEFYWHNDWALLAL